MTVIGTYDPYLVALSIAVACLASYTALDLGGRIRDSRRWERLAWLVTAATAMGGGIWSMHFIGMLAFVMPMPVSYDRGPTLLSLVVAIGVTGFGFFMIGTGRVTPLEFALSGSFVGIGIIAMHYTGMAAMRMPVDIRYDPFLIALSVLIAIGASIAALWLAFRTNTRTSQAFLAAVVMGFAISGMHYTGMAAATFIAAPGMDWAHGRAALAQTGLALAIATITFVILLLALVASAVDRKLVERNRELDEKNRQLRQANDELIAVYEQGMFASHLNMEGRIIYANRACVEDLGLARADIIGKPFWEAGWWYMPEAQEWIRKAFEQAAAGTPFRGELSYVYNKDGSERVTDIAFVPIKDEAGRVMSVFVPGTDVTDRARQYRATFENAGVGIAHLSPDSKWLRVNQTFARIVDYSPDELVSKSVQDITHPDDLDLSPRQLERLRSGKADSYEMEKRYVRKDGTPVWVHVTGNAVRRSDGSIDHFVAFVQDISAHKHAEQLLQRQAALLDQSHDAILTWKVGGRGIVYWSRGAEMLYGYSADEAIGRVSHELLQTRAILPIEEIEAQVVEQGSWYGEITHTTRDGRKIVVETRLVRVSYDGETYAFETNRDITQRKRAEEQVRLLMREVSHRSKNMLGLVQAIARQTTTSDPEHFIERFTDRIQALAANQDLLVQTKWRGVDVDDLVRAQLAHFSDLVGYRISLNGPKQRLNGVAAQAIGMALHELATNAGKYGALLTNAGRVDIVWRVDGDVFKMGWIERHGPPVKPPARRGFGSTVIEAMAKRAVDGEVQLEYDPAGVVWHLTCPAANALEPGGATDVEEGHAVILNPKNAMALAGMEPRPTASAETLSAPE
jgi:PAS domain S-box-containing protein